jgi:predicted DNA-binding transcriptional regulator AlpA
MQNNTFLSPEQVAARFGVSKTTIWRWRGSKNNFPQPFTLSSGTTRWRLADLEAWEAEQSQG